MLDVDGTLIPYLYEALPSDKIVEAIGKAKEKVAISLVTGRSYATVKTVLKRLNITEGYAVVNNGSVVIDVSNDTVVYERYIEPSDLERIISYFEEKNIPFFIKQSALDSKAFLSPYAKGDSVEKGSMLFTDEIFTSNEAESHLAFLSQFPSIHANKQHHREPHKYSLSICHVQATKLHGVHEIAKRLNLDPKTFIGAGDSYNDFPLLMACGLKVAMGNAAEELKAIADYVAPSVEEDGIADVIEKFVLNSK